MKAVFWILFGIIGTGGTGMAGTSVSSPANIVVPEGYSLVQSRSYRTVPQVPVTTTHETYVPATFREEDIDGETRRVVVTPARIVKTKDSSSPGLVSRADMRVNHTLHPQPEYYVLRDRFGTVVQAWKIVGDGSNKFPSKPRTWINPIF